MGYAKSVSRGESVFVDESPEPISALDEVRRRMHDLQLPGRRIRRVGCVKSVRPTNPRFPRMRSNLRTPQAAWISHAHIGCTGKLERGRHELQYRTVVVRC